MKTQINQISPTANKINPVMIKLVRLTVFTLCLFIFCSFSTSFAQSGFPGDANGDGYVDGIDYVIWLNRYNSSTSRGPTDGDFNGDNRVDGLDYVIWLNNYGRSQTVPTATPRPTITPFVPSPTLPSGPTPPPGSSFNFISWSDTETSLATFGQLSNQALTLQPEFTIYNGDAEGGQGLSGWQTYLNGNTNNGMSGKTFVVRGNGNSGDSNWSSFFNFNQVANTIGATNYTQLSANMTYSFDYSNSRFIGLDIPGCGISLFTQSKVDWAQSRITDAEARGLTHVFLFMHGPIWYANNHSDCTLPTNFVTMVSNHPIVTASFHGHEHLKSVVSFGPSDSRINMSHNYYQIMSGGAGGGTYPCVSSRLNTATDYCDKFEGFADVTVSGRTVTINFYRQGNTTPAKTVNFSK